MSPFAVSAVAALAAPPTARAIAALPRPRAQAARQEPSTTSWTQ